MYIRLRGGDVRKYCSRVSLETSLNKAPVKIITLPDIRPNHFNGAFPGLLTDI